jgi:hypothetical protein
MFQNQRIMEPESRRTLAAAKLSNFRSEVAGLRGAGIAYQIGFGLLLLLLAPVLVFEMALARYLGVDIRVFVPEQPFEPPELVEQEVPESLRDLIPLAKKFGIGDDPERGEVISIATKSERTELLDRVGPKLDLIDRWLGESPEDGLNDTSAFFLYLGEAYEEVRLDEPGDET